MTPAVSSLPIGRRACFWRGVFAVLSLASGALVAQAGEESPRCLTPTSRANLVAPQSTPDRSLWPAPPWPEGMVWIPSGEFDMGGIGPEARADEFPVHRVAIDGFWLDATEVSNAAFRRFVEATGYVTTAERRPDWNELKKQLPPGTPQPDDSVLVPGALVFKVPQAPVPLDNPAHWWEWVRGADWKHPAGPPSHLAESDERLPVVQVSWDDAMAFCKWAGKRLPTEAEWEYAALDGQPARRFTWGDEPPSETFHPANLWQGDFPHRPTPLDGYTLSAPVDADRPSTFGLHHMIGNVWEWCADWYRPDTYASRSASGAVSTNPTGPGESFDPDEPGVPKRVNRGGSFLCDASYCASYRPAARMKTSPDTGLLNLGFRAALSESAWRQHLQDQNRASK